MWIKFFMGYFCVIFIRKFTIQGIPLGTHLSSGYLKEETITQEITFPNSVETDDEANHFIPVPSCKENSSFCETVDDYPYQKFYKILRNTNMTSYFKMKAETSDDFISGRYYNNKEYYLCSSTRHKLFPQVAHNLKNKRRFIYNLPGHRQGVKVERCKMEGSNCSLYKRQIKTIRTKCKQEYTKVGLLVADDKGMPIWDLFWFPSACACSYKRVINFNG